MQQTQSVGCFIPHHCEGRLTFNLSIKPVGHGLLDVAPLDCLVSTVRPRQNDRHFADDSSKLISLNGISCILNQIWLKSIAGGPIHNNPAMVEIKAWCQAGIIWTMFSLLTQICITQLAQMPFRSSIEIWLGDVLTIHVFMVMSSNGNVFRVTDPLCGEFTGHRWIPLTKTSDAELWWFLWSVPWINGWINNREAGELRRHRAHYDVIVMWWKGV